MPPKICTASAVRATAASLAKHFASEQAAVAERGFLLASSFAAADSVQQAGGLRVLRHVGEHPLDALEVGDRLTELLARLGVVDRGVERGLQDADGQRGDTDTAFVERAHHHVEAAVRLAQQSIARQRDVVEPQSADLRRALAHLVLLRAGRDAG